MRVLLNAYGMDERLQAALRSQAFTGCVPENLSGNFDILAISSKGISRADTESSYAGLVPKSEIAGLVALTSVKPADLLQHALRVVSLPHNLDLGVSETTKFIDFMDMEHDKVIKCELDVHNSEIFGAILGQYLFKAELPTNERATLAPESAL